MQAMVLEKACIQCGLCAGLCPEVFALNSGEPARVTVDPIPDAQKIGVQEASKLEIILRLGFLVK